MKLIRARVYRGERIEFVADEYGVPPEVVIVVIFALGYFLVQYSKGTNPGSATQPSSGTTAPITAPASPTPATGK